MLVPSRSQVTSTRKVSWHLQNKDQQSERHRLRREEAVDINEVQQITVGEVRSQMKQLKNGQVPVSDNLPNELLKYEGGKLAEHSTRLYNKILKNATTPHEWKKSILITLFKNGKTLNPSNYFFQIFLLSNILKLFIRLIGQHILRHTTVSEE